MAGLPILCYHKVGSAVDEGRWLNIEPPRLESHARFFSRRGYDFVLASDLCDPAAWAGRAVCFTFDDAYASTMANAPAAMERHGGRGTFYAVSLMVGQTSSWDGERARPLADWADLLRAQAAGHEIGNHTSTHPNLVCVDSRTASAEIGDAHLELTSKGVRVRSFCYPYGGEIDEVRKLVAKLYPVALALGKRPAERTDALLALPRVVVAYSDALPKLLYKIHLRPLLGQTGGS